MNVAYTGLNAAAPSLRLFSLRVLAHTQCPCPRSRAPLPSYWIFSSSPCVPQLHRYHPKSAAQVHHYMNSSNKRPDYCYAVFALSAYCLNMLMRTLYIS
jgi:hypothetical protein